MLKKTEIILFGSGLVGRQLLNQYLEKFSVIAFADNDQKKQNGTLSNIPIIAPIQLNRMNFDYIVITSTSIEPIRKQLIELGIPEKKIKTYMDHKTITRNRFPYDALLFILLISSLVIYLTLSFFN